MRLLLLLALFSLSGCPTDTGARTPKKECTNAGDLCKLPEGPLGVCAPTACKPGEPCLRCMPQH
jgi:hypothetical protein